MNRQSALIAVGVVCATMMTWVSGAATQLGASQVSGSVVTAGVTPAPLARALVTLSGASLKPSRTVITDDHGRFLFRNLPAGTFVIVASRPPYVKTAFGARRPGRPGTPIELATGQHLNDLTIPMSRGGAITGTIRHPAGEPAPAVQVEVLPLDALADPLAGSIVTDDRGVYRAFGLPPGRYVVSARVSDYIGPELTQFSDAEMDDLLEKLKRRSTSILPGAGVARPPTYGRAPIFYPGTADPAEAAVLVVAAGDERSGIDVALRLVRTVAIEGRVSSAGGAVPAGTQITLTRLGLTGIPGPTFVSPANTRQPDAAGSFRFTGVSPGRYRLLARAMDISTLWALDEITIREADVSGISLALQPGLRWSGRIAFDAQARTPPGDVTTVRLRPVEVTGASQVVPPSAARPDGTFEINVLLPGVYTMTSTLEDGWWLRSVVVNGRDVLDFPLDLGPGGDVSGAVATFSDRRTELSGTLQTAASTPATDYFVLVFAADRAFWRPAARRIQFTRPNTDGRFAFRDLPPGDYLIAALTDLEPTDLLDGFFLEGLLAAAVPVRLGDGERKTQDLRIIR